MAHQLSDGAVEEIFWKGATGAQSGQAYILQASPATSSFVFPLLDNGGCGRIRGMSC
jgi:hypothetical protein